MPGTARDGSKCYTRTNNAGGKYTTCEGEQKRNRKVQREISKLHERTRVKVTKDEFNEARAGLQQTLTRPSGEAAAPQVLIPQVRDERIDTKVRQLDGRPWKSGRGRAKNPHTWIAMGPDGRATSEALMKVVSDYESGVLSKTEVNTVIYRASQIILDERGAEGALAGLQTDYQQDVDDIALQTTAALDRVFNFEVAEAPGVVAMTSTMTPLGQATFDALLGMGFDVSAGISAAVAARTPYALLTEKAKKGTLEFEEFYEYLLDEDEDFVEGLRGNFDDRQEVFGYNPDYWIHQVNEDADHWGDLDDDDNEKLLELMRDEADEDQKEHLESEFNQHIRGRKFNSLDEAIELFKKEVDYW
jgi:hypothetical protein